MIWTELVIGNIVRRVLRLIREEEEEELTEQGNASSQTVPLNPPSTPTGMQM